MARVVEETLPPGSHLEDLVIEKVLGQGGFGVNYLARATTLDADVVVKEYYPQQFAQRSEDGNVEPGRADGDEAFFADGLDRFLEEARALARMTRGEDAFGVMPVLRYFTARGTAYIVMPYVEGQSLADQINYTGPLEADALMVLTERLLDVLQRVHDEGLLHRDITPGNVFIPNNGEPLLADFGLVRSLGDPRKSHYPIFSEGYAAPEQYSVTSKQGPWTDIYGLAATLYDAAGAGTPQSAAGRLLNDRLEPLSDVAGRTLDPNFVSFIASGLALDPSARPPTVAQWRSILTAGAAPGGGPGAGGGHAVLDEAWRQLAGGDIDTGRALLGDHWQQNPHDTEAAAMLAVELFRPPVDYGPAIRHQNKVINDYGAEVVTIPLDIISSVEWGSRGSLNKLLRRLKLSDPPTSVHGAWMLALAELYVTDDRLQIEIIDEPAPTIVSDIMTGAAYLVRGCPRAANSIFTKVIADPDSVLKPYKKRFRSLSGERQKQLRQRVLEVAMLGQLLADRELGRAGKSVAGWQALHALRPGWPIGSEFLVAEARQLADGTANAPPRPGPDRDPDITDERAWGGMVFRDMEREKNYAASESSGRLMDAVKIISVLALIAAALYFAG